MSHSDAWASMEQPDRIIIYTQCQYWAAKFVLNQKIDDQK